MTGATGRLALALAAAALAGCADESYQCADGHTVVSFAVLPGGGIAQGAFDYHPHNMPDWVRVVEVDADRARLELTQDWASIDDDGNRVSGTRLEIFELDRDDMLLFVATRDWHGDDHAAPPWDEVIECRRTSAMHELFLLLGAMVMETL